MEEKLRKAKVKDKILMFPESWDKEKIISWLNTEMRSCPFCCRVDVEINHFGKCRGADDLHNSPTGTPYNNLKNGPSW